MILIDEEKAIKMGGGVVAKILTACTVAPPESAEKFAEEIIEIYNGVLDYTPEFSTQDTIAALITTHTEARVAEERDKWVGLCKKQGLVIADLERENRRVKEAFDEANKIAVGLKEVNDALRAFWRAYNRREAARNRR